MKRFTRTRDWTGHLSSDPIVSRLNRIERTRKSSRDRGRSVHAMFPTNVRAIGIRCWNYGCQIRCSTKDGKRAHRTFDTNVCCKKLEARVYIHNDLISVRIFFLLACEPCPTGIFIKAVAYLFVDHCASFDFSRRSYLYYVGEKFLLDAIVMHSVDIITRVNILFLFLAR